MTKSAVMGFQLYPPLSTIPDLVAWDEFLEHLRATLQSKSVLSSDKLELDIPGRPYLVRDGLFFRQLVIQRHPLTEAVAFEVFHLAATNFPGRVFPLTSRKYTEADLLADCMTINKIESEKAPVSKAHCAYCLTAVLPEELIRCSGCNRRSYCSVECKNMDCTSEGQQHSVWCSLGVCEENIDWEILPVEGKGFGIVAKRMIPKKSRIMVDVARPPIFPPVRDLEPLHGTVLEKERLNAFRFHEESFLFVRAARMNHSCNSNACQVFEDGLMIVTSLRDVQPGEEICINYTNLNGKSSHCSPKEARELLQQKWGIICPHDCICRNPQYGEDLECCRRLQREVAQLLDYQILDGAIKKVDSLLSALEKINPTWLWLEDAYWSAFTLASHSPSLMHLAAEYGREAISIHKAICNPGSETVEDMEIAVSEPQRYVESLSKLSARPA